jgi:hypothetical protein
MIQDEWLPEDMIEILLDHGEEVNECFEGISFYQQMMLVSIDFLVPMHTERVLSLLLDYGQTSHAPSIQSATNAPCCINTFTV